MGKDLKKVFLTSGFPNKIGTQQMLYMIISILTEPMYGGPINDVSFPCLSPLYIHRLFFKSLVFIFCTYIVSAYILLST